MNYPTTTPRTRASTPTLWETLKTHAGNLYNKANSALKQRTATNKSITSTPSPSPLRNPMPYMPTQPSNTVKYGGKRRNRNKKTNRKKKSKGAKGKGRKSRAKKTRRKH